MSLNLNRDLTISQLINIYQDIQNVIDNIKDPVLKLKTMRIQSKIKTIIVSK